MSERDLAERLKDFLEGRSLKQADVVRATGIDKGRLSRFLSGRSNLAETNREVLEGYLEGSEETRSVLEDGVARVLAEKLEAGRLAVFVGAGLSHLAPAKDGSSRRLPLWSELASRVAKDCHFEEADVFENPLELFDAISYGPSVGRGEVEESVARHVDDQEFHLSDSHEIMARLPFKAVLTTNYDCLLDRVFLISVEDRKCAAVVDEDDYFQFERFLLKLHGSIRTLDGRDPNLHTLTEEDYRNWKEKHPHAFRTLEQIFVDYTVLYVGYGLGDSHFMALQENVKQANPRKARSYVWAWKPSPAQIRLRETRDGMIVTPLSTEGDYAAAFRQIEEALADVRAGKSVEKAGADKLSREEDARQWERYLTAVEHTHGPANLEGLYIGRSYGRDRIKLEDLFVTPDLIPLREARPEEQNLSWLANFVALTEAEVEDASQEGETPSAFWKKWVEEESEISEIEKAVYYSGAQWGIGMSAAFHPEFFSALQAREKRERTDAFREMSSSPRTAIIGDPGQGKSSLLQIFLIRSAREVLGTLQSDESEVAIPKRPVFLRLSLWEDHGAPSTPEGFLGFAREQILEEANVSEEAVDEWLESPVHWLLDGIDEIRNRDHRFQLRKLISDLGRGDREEFSKDSWTVTSRPSGYFEGGMGVAWGEWELDDLNDQQGGELLQRWQDLLWNLERLEFEGADVLPQLKENSGLSRVVGNPLLMTMVVLFYMRRQKLPDDRWQFYEHATTALAESWQTYRSRRVRHDRQHFAFLHKFLSRIALRMMLDGAVVMEAREFRRELEKLLRERGYSGKSLDEEAAEFCRAAEDLIGVIVSKGANRYGFLHLSFQEYYAAREIEEETLELDAEIVRLWDHPDWQEVWDLFSLALTSKSRLVAFFQRVCEERHYLDEFLRRPELSCLKWAGMSQSILSDDPVVTGLVEVVIGDRNIDGEMMDPVGLIATFFRRNSLPPLISGTLLRGLNDESRFVAEDAARALKTIVERDDVREAFLKALGDEGSNVRFSAARALENVVERDDVREAFLKALSDEDSNMRYHAARALENMVERDDVREAFLKALSDESVPVRSSVARELRNAVERDDVRQALLETLSDEDPKVRSNAARAFGKVIERDDVRGAFLKALGDKKPGVRSGAAIALRGVVERDDIREAFLKALSDEHWFVAQEAAIALVHVIERADVREAFLKALSDRSSRVRSSVARALGMSVERADVREALLNALNDEDANVRSSAARALENAVEQDDVCKASLKTLSDEKPSVRFSAARALRSMVERADVREAFLKALGDEHWIVAEEAARALGNVIERDDVREAFLKALRDKSSRVRSSVARELGKVVERDDARKAVLKALSDEDSNVRFGAAKALRSIVERADVREAFLKALNDRSSRVRFPVVRALGSLGEGDDIREALLMALGDEDKTVRSEASSGLRRWITNEKFPGRVPLS